jgi:hypothetical protein
MAFEIKRHDTRVPYVAALMSDGVPINLAAAASVRFKMRAQGAIDSTTPPKVNGVCTITNAASGIVTYVWTTNDLDTVGDYDVEFEILWADGGIQTVPNSDYNVVSVNEDLDQA